MNNHTGNVGRVLDYLKNHQGITSMKVLNYLVQLGYLPLFLI